MAVWNEQRLLEKALRSFTKVFPAQDVLVFDGAWKGYGDGASTDDTKAIAEAAGVTWVRTRRGGWEAQEQKRTAMFVKACMWGYSHALVLDGDERLSGKLPTDLPEGHASVRLRSVGPNDLPGVRGVYPHGDYGLEWHPQLRWFRLSPELHCKWPGGYWDADGQVVAESLMPQPRISHHASAREADRIAAKRRYYAEEHPKRNARVRRHAMATLPPAALDDLEGRYRRKLDRALAQNRKVDVARLRLVLEDVEACRGT